MAAHSVYLPDGSDDQWTAEHRPLLRARRYWREGSLPTPETLQRRAPWGETTERFLWYELRGHHGGAIAAAAPPTVEGYVNGASGSGCVGSGGGCGGGGSGERIALAPAWLVAMENGLGLKGKHWLYGATPSPAVLIHYTCTTQTEAARIWPLKLFGHWHESAVSAEVSQAELVDAAAPAAPSSSYPPPKPPTAVSLLALEVGTLRSPLNGVSWSQLNLLHALLGGLASLSGRTLVAPAINCTGTGGRRAVYDASAPPRARRRSATSEPALSSRCFWQMHSHGGAQCVLRIGGCTELATPTAGDEAETAARAQGRPPAVVTLDLAAASAGTSSAVDALQALTSHRIVMLRVRMPSLAEVAELDAPRRGGGRAGRSLLDHAQRVLVEPRLRAAMRTFRRRCADLTSGPACNNICS